MLSCASICQLTALVEHDGPEADERLELEQRRGQRGQQWHLHLLVPTAHHQLVAQKLHTHTHGKERDGRMSDWGRQFDYVEWIRLKYGSQEVLEPSRCTCT